MNINKNKNLHKAKKQKNDEFYTRRQDIEAELSHYRDQFRGKIIFCNCDDPKESEFWKYFRANFTFLGLKKLISTHYEDNKPSYKLELTRDVNKDGKVDDEDIVKTKLKQNGDFRSDECIEILKESDIVCTNPPFSLFREYVAQLMKYKKKFLIISNFNAIVNDKDIFKYVAKNKAWMGYSPRGMDFINSEGEMENINATWFTNLDVKKRHENLILTKKYNKKDYPKYDGYNIINVNKVKDIPIDYNEVMGVPITFLDKYNPKQFKIVGATNNKHKNCISFTSYINGQKTYARLLIKNKNI